MKPEKQNKKFDGVFNILKEPIKESSLRSKDKVFYIKEFFEILKEVLREGYQISGPFSFLMFSLFVLLYVVFPFFPLLVLIFIAFVVSYGVFSVNMVGVNIKEFLRDQLSPFNIFVYNDVKSRKNIENDDICKLADKLSEKFSLKYLQEFQEYLMGDFKKFDERSSTAIAFNSLLITIFTILIATVDSFKKLPLFLAIGFSTVIFNVFIFILKNYDKVFISVGQAIKKLDVDVYKLKEKKPESE